MLAVPGFTTQKLPDFPPTHASTLTKSPPAYITLSHSNASRCHKWLLKVLAWLFIECSSILRLDVCFPLFTHNDNMTLTSISATIFSITFLVFTQHVGSNTVKNYSGKTLDTHEKASLLD